jgi:ABC-type glycerol-3-phosphate transport system substrate-binding protein
MKRSKIAGIALIATTAIALTGCGAGGSGSQGDKEFTYWSMWQQGEPQQVALQNSIDAFTAETGIKVDVQWAGRAVLAQVTTALNAGNGPALVDQDGPSLVSALGATSAARDVSEILSGKASDGSDLSSVLIPGIADSFIDADGNPIVVPYELTGQTIWFNKKVDPELAANPPKTWDDFTSYIDDAVDAGRTPIAVDSDLAILDTVWVSHAIVRHGGVGSLQKAALDESGEEFRNNPAFHDAAADLLPLMSSEVIGKQGTQWPAQQTAWADGSGGSNLLFQGTWIPSETAAALTQSGIDPASQIEYGSFPYPNVDGGKGNDAVDATAIGFSILADSKGADEAEKFVKFFLSKDQLAPIATDAQNMTSRTDIPAPDVLSTYADNVLNATSTFLDDDGAGMVAPGWLKDVYQPICADLFYGKITSADDFVELLASKTASYYKSK